MNRIESLREKNTPGYILKSAKSDTIAKY